MKVNEIFVYKLRLGLSFAIFLFTQPLLKLKLETFCFQAMGLSEFISASGNEI